MMQQPHPKRQGLKILLGGLAFVALTVVALVATNTLYIWPAILGGVFTLAGLVMVAMKK